MADNPKVLIGCPTYDGKEYCLNTYLAACKKLTYSNKEFLFVDNSKEAGYDEKIREKGFEVERVLPVGDATVQQTVANCRNLLRKKMIEGDFEYFLSLEQDVIPPPNLIEQLLKQDKKIIAGVYYTVYKLGNGQKIRPLLWKEVNQHRMVFLTEESKSGKVLEVRATGLGCMLIHRSVLEKLQFDVNPATASFDDVVFCSQAKDAGHRVFVDTSAQCRHVILMDETPVELFLGQNKKMVARPFLGD
jgi:GT2 family glycosyltransferase